MNTCTRTHTFLKGQYLSINAKIILFFFFFFLKRSRKGKRGSEVEGILFVKGSHFRCLSILSVDLLPLSEDP